MVRDDRLYAFVVSPGKYSPTRIRRISLTKRSVLILSAFALACCVGVSYGFYGLSQQLFHLHVSNENHRLRAENETQRMQLAELNERIDAVEDASRRLVELSGVTEPEVAMLVGAGGPVIPLNEVLTLASVESKTKNLEHDLARIEKVVRERTRVPGLWPVLGELESGFGGRRNPFGGSSFEFHTGQDIDAPFGAPVIAAARGTVAYAGWQNGYGQLVVIDHGDGLTSRYGHLSRIHAAVGQSVKRGQLIGLVGSTGRSTGPHLHYEIRINDSPIDPRPYLETK